MLDIILPNGCVLCGDSVDNCKVCSKCQSDFRPLRDNSACIICGVPMGLNDSVPYKKCGTCVDGNFYFNSARSIFLYKGKLKKLVQLFKYEKAYHLSGFFADCISGYIATEIHKDTTLVPVPLHINKLRLRGFNQSAMICREISIKTGCNYDLFTLKKRSDTRPQVEIKSFEERQKNVRNAYYVTGRNSISGKEIILIDDVFTSGSTVNECSRVLIENGANSVKVVTVARSVLH